MISKKLLVQYWLYQYFGNLLVISYSKKGTIIYTVFNVINKNKVKKQETNFSNTWITIECVFI